jgi:hypothetical protein
MPIRFACPYCQQKLSVSSRKAGLPADCPRCRRVLTIPQPPPETEREPALAPVAAVAEDEIAAAPLPGPLLFAAPAPREEAPIDTGGETVRPSIIPSAVEGPSLEAAEIDAETAPDAAGGFEGLELVYDSPPARDRVAAPPVAADLIAVPRYAIYLQGGLLAVVAFLAFVIGLLTGGTVLRGPPPPTAPQACLLSGSVTYSSGPRQLPDEGAVVAVIPQSQERPDEKAPIEGLRPGDPTPGAEHRGIAILRQLGGGYARADSGGRFQIQVPRQGRYLVLVISREKAIRSMNDIDTADILQLGPFFANAADLLGDRRYQLTQQTLRGDKQLQIAF